MKCEITKQDGNSTEFKIEGYGNNASKEFQKRVIETRLKILQDFNNSLEKEMTMIAQSQKFTMSQKIGLLNSIVCSVYSSVSGKIFVELSPVLGTSETKKLMSSVTDMAFRIETSRKSKNDK